jgi:hypothetical protein
MNEKDLLFKVQFSAFFYASVQRGYGANRQHNRADH